LWFSSLFSFFSSLTFSILSLRFCSSLSLCAFSYVF
jgi:hypothetical protein